MKSKMNMKAVLILGFGIFSFGISFSQQDTTKKKGTVDITSAFKPVLKESAKINFNASPAVNDTTKPKLNYDIPNQNLLFAYTPGSLRPLALDIDSGGYWDMNSYIKAGFRKLKDPVCASRDLFWGWENCRAEYLCKTYFIVRERTLPGLSQYKC
jgi:hypothetical protein